MLVFQPKIQFNPPNNTGSLVGSWTTTTNNQWRISNINSWGLALWLIEAQWLDVRAQCHQEWICNLRIPRPQVHPGISHHIIRFFSVWIPIFHSYLGYLHRASRHLRKASPNISHDLRQFILLHSPIISHVFIVFRSLWCFITPYTFHYFSLVRMVLSWYYHGIIMVYHGILWYIVVYCGISPCFSSLLSAYPNRTPAVSPRLLRQSLTHGVHFEGNPVGPRGPGGRKLWVIYGLHHSMCRKTYTYNHIYIYIYCCINT